MKHEGVSKQTGDTRFDIDKIAKNESPREGGVRGSIGFLDHRLKQFATSVATQVDNYAEMNNLQKYKTKKMAGFSNVLTSHGLLNIEDDRLLEFVSLGLASDNYDSRLASARLSEKLNPGERNVVENQLEKTIKHGLANSDWAVSLKASKMIKFLQSEGKRRSLYEILRQHLTLTLASHVGDSYNVFSASARMLKAIPESYEWKEDLYKMFVLKLSYYLAKEPILFFHAGELISILKDEERKIVQAKFFDIIKNKLSSWILRSEDITYTLRSLQHLNHEQRMQVTLDVIRSGDRDKNTVLFKSLGYLFEEDDIKYLFDDYFDSTKKDGREVQASDALPDQSMFDNIRISHSTGYSNLQIGRDTANTQTRVYNKAPLNRGGDLDLKYKVASNYIGIEAFAVWLKAYEAIDTWKELGLKHNPISPILGFNLTSGSNKYPDYEYDAVVHTPILGASVYDWYKGDNYKYRKEIELQKSKILKGLKMLGLRHGDEHNGNFVVYFEEGDEGMPDISKPPQVFAIDLEKARLIHT